MEKHRKKAATYFEMPRSVAHDPKLHQIILSFAKFREQGNSF